MKTKLIINIALAVGAIILAVVIAKQLGKYLNTGAHFVNPENPDGDLSPTDEGRIKLLASEINTVLNATTYIPEVFGGSLKDTVLSKILQLNNSELAILNNYYNSTFYSSGGSLMEVVKDQSSWSVTTSIQDAVINRLIQIGVV
jgi:hypothetical protein